MLHIKISRSLIFKICLIAGLMLSAQFRFAGDPIPIPIPKDDSPPPEQGKYGMTTEPSASATISDTELDVYFEYSVRDATITVYDADNNVVYQETVDTDATFATSIPVSNWSAGDYRITVTYGTTTQRGYFSLE
jgi:hypothetical protein